MKGFKKILIAVNGSPEVLVHGLNLAKDEGCWATVVKVVPAYEGDLNLVGIKNIRDVLNGEGEEAIREIENVAKAERGMIKARLEEGSIHKKIVDVAEDERCDLIVMGRRNKKGLSRFFRNNTLSKVINSSLCPVLVVDV